MQRRGAKALGQQELLAMAVTCVRVSRGVVLILVAVAVCSSVTAVAAIADVAVAVA